MEESSIVEQKETSPSLSRNDDLKELCILLDEERNKLHELAEQWRHFGTSAIHKLECQIVDYQERLNDLEQRQILILEENESLKFLINQTMNDNPSKDKIPTKESPSHHLCFPRSKSMHDHLSRTRASVQSKLSTNKFTIDDPFQQQISIENIFDAIKTAEVYESIEGMINNNDEFKKKLLKEFCHLVWKYLEDRSKRKNSCLL